MIPATLIADVLVGVAQREYHLLATPPVPETWPEMWAILVEKDGIQTVLLLSVVPDVDDLNRFVSNGDKVEHYIFQKQNRATQTLMIYASGPPWLINWADADLRANGSFSAPT
jgi:hypothetical protein